MFGLSWTQIILIVLVGLFVLGPERIPTAVTASMRGLRKMRDMAQGAQAQLNSEIGPEIEEMRRQIAELQSLKELQGLRELRDLSPRKLIGNTLLGNENSKGGVAGFLGLDTDLLSAPVKAEPAESAPTVEGAESPAPAVPAASAPKPVGQRPLEVGERPPFDADGT